MGVTPRGPTGDGDGGLTRPTVDEERHARRLWRRADDGMDGPRSAVVPERPDDAVASKLLDAAGDAIGRGDRQRGVNILKLVVRDYRKKMEKCRDPNSVECTILRTSML